MAPGCKSPMFILFGILLSSSAYSWAQRFKCEPNKFRCANSNCIPETWVCDYENDCGDGSDEKQCLTRTCAPNEYQCSNGLCILSTWVCDGDPDCQDKADEKDCSATTCKPSEYKCQQGGCIKRQWLCDGTKDCKKGDDEANCATSTCPSGKFRCQNGSKCISQLWVCDGDPDCDDGSDEYFTGCLAPTCPPEYFMCNNNKCIPSVWHCDHEDDCGDESDENSCVFKSTERPLTTEKGTTIYATTMRESLLGKSVIVATKTSPVATILKEKPTERGGLLAQVKAATTIIPTTTTSTTGITEEPRHTNATTSNRTTGDTIPTTTTSTTGITEEPRHTNATTSNRTTEEAIPTTTTSTTTASTGRTGDTLPTTTTSTTTASTGRTTEDTIPTTTTSTTTASTTTASTTTASSRTITQGDRLVTTTSRRITDVIKTPRTSSISTRRITKHTRMSTVVPVSKIVTYIKPNATVKFITTRKPTATATTHAPVMISSTNQRGPFTYFYPSPTKQPRCGGILTSPKGMIQSPNFPLAYPDNVDCKWIISLPKYYHVITIVIETMFLELDQNCAYDYLMFLDKLYNQVGCRHCGSYVQAKVLDIKGHVAIVEFHSDLNHGKSGFRLRYQAHWK